MTARTPSVARKRLAGLAALAVLALAVATTLGVYTRAFKPATMVTIDAPRAGLLMDKGAQVRLHGLQVGEVRDVEPGTGGDAILSVALEPDHVPLIPRDVAADITPTTVFGAKYVDLLTSGAAVTEPVAAGSVIRAVDVTVEANDIFGQLQEVLTTVEPDRLNATLTAMATALDGRGSDLGVYLSEVNTYLGHLNGSMPALATDLDRADDVLDTYADVAPDLISTAGHLTVTSRTLDRQSAALQAMLTSFISAAAAADDLLVASAEPMVTSLALLRPVSDTFGRYSTELPCLLEGLVKHRDATVEVLGADLPGIQGLVSLLPSQQGYQYPRDLPKLVPDSGPDCLSLPEMKLTNPPHRDFDDGVGVYDEGSDQLSVGKDPVKVYLDLLEGWFGTTGLNALIDELARAGAVK